MTVKRAEELFQKYSNTWGADVTTYRFDAIRDGKVVKSVTCGPAMEFHLKTEVSSTTLEEKTTYDVAAIRIEAVSEEGNLLVFANDPLIFHTEGDIELIGPSVVPLRGGAAGTYVKSVGKSGTGTLTIECGRCPDLTIHFDIKA